MPSADDGVGLRGPSSDVAHRPRPPESSRPKSLKSSAMSGELASRKRRSRSNRCSGLELVSLAPIDSPHTIIQSTARILPSRDTHTPLRRVCRQHQHGADVLVNFVTVVVAAGCPNPDPLTQARTPNHVQPCASLPAIDWSPTTTATTTATTATTSTTTTSTL